MAVYFYSIEEAEVDSEVSETTSSLPAPDSTRTVEKIDWESLEYVYYEKKKKIKNIPYTPPGEEQIIIEGKRYRIRKTPTHTEYIPIR